MGASLSLLVSAIAPESDVLYLGRLDGRDNQRGAIDTLYCIGEGTRAAGEQRERQAVVHGYIVARVAQGLTQRLHLPDTGGIRGLADNDRANRAESGVFVGFDFSFQVAAGFVQHHNPEAMLLDIDQLRRQIVRRDHGRAGNGFAGA